MRIAIEVGVATVAAERIDDEALRIMGEAVERMDAATEFEEYRRADVRFHIAIAQSTELAQPRRRAIAALDRFDGAEVRAALAGVAARP